MVAAYVTSSSAEATSMTLPTHQAGDLLIMCALRTDSSSPPTIPTEWILIGVNSGLNNDNLVVGYRIATASGTASGTWTNAAFLACAVYRDATNYVTTGYRNGARSIVAGTNMPNFQAKAAKSTNTGPGSESSRMVSDTGLVIGVVSSPSTSVSLSPAPSGMTNRATLSGASASQIAIHDTGSAVGSWAATLATLSGSTPWITAVFDLVDIGISKSGGGTSRPWHALKTPHVIG